uniref:WEB family protein At3g51220 n=1 Tax=Ananas comosus var. bracteatus TaxID=296719 RepID=A0A6V7QG66_ANACO|nr:unnamed protein product [Ananas comosus var. bracteatus]
MERAEVDTTRPFRSVKEAVAVFGERFLVGDAASSSCHKPNSNAKLGISPPKPPMYSAASSPRSYSSSASQLNQEANREYDEHEPEDEAEPEPVILSSLKKLEAELAETKQDVVLLKKRESEMDLAVASLNAQLHKSLSKLAEIDAEKAAESSTEIEEGPYKIRSNRWGEKNEEMGMSFEYLPSLAQALRLGEVEDDFGARRNRKARKEEKKKKKKPIVPLIGDLLFFRRKSSGGDDENHFLYAQSFL